MKKTEQRRAARRRRRQQRRAERAKRIRARKIKRRERRRQRAARDDEPTPDAPEHAGERAEAGAAERRQQALELLESAHSALVVSRREFVIELACASPGTDAHDQLARRCEAINDEIDDIRDQSDDLLRQVGPFSLPMSEVEKLDAALRSARKQAAAAERADALLGAAEGVLNMIEKAIEKD